MVDKYDIALDYFFNLHGNNSPSPWVGVVDSFLSVETVQELHLAQSLLGGNAYES